MIRADGALDPEERPSALIDVHANIRPRSATERMLALGIAINFRHVDLNAGSPGLNVLPNGGMAQLNRVAGS